MFKFSKLLFIKFPTHSNLFLYSFGLSRHPITSFVNIEFCSFIPNLFTFLSYSTTWLGLQTNIGKEVVLSGLLSCSQSQKKDFFRFHHYIIVFTTDIFVSYTVYLFIISSYVFNVHKICLYCLLAHNILLSF